MIFYIHMWGNSIFGQKTTIFLYSCKAYLQHSIVNYATHPYRCSTFLCGIIWHFHWFLKEDIYSVTCFISKWFAWQSLKVSRSCKRDDNLLLWVPIMGSCVKWKEGWDLFTTIYRLHSVSRFLVWLPIFAERWYKCTITYFYHKDVMVMLATGKVHRGTYQAAKPWSCLSVEQSEGNIILQYWVTAQEQHLTEANAVANMFNGWFCQKTAHAFHWFKLALRIEMSNKSQSISTVTKLRRVTHWVMGNCSLFALKRWNKRKK